MKALEIAINGYQVEYNLPPGALQSPSSETTPARSQGPLIQSLMAQNKIDNPRNIIFFEPNIRKGNSSGLIPDHQPASFVDSWGQPYYILVDSDADQQIPNPDPSPKKSSPVLNSKTIIYSSGPDQDPLTWDDNITSWE
ncbi:hypothetical protein FEM03_14240 [Phragmitibacter flavus]|uniref:Uncharacterized protein n=1 Tax=Phragmitibacter flavus TaxID=2576071 RepID=A0A5R8KC29_9BACT|nr:hypothetical protein [Phragmitibacter flavus]TLD69893.1 hypothetical protein FEM03_14240 [Phragmitibacter flavus]